MGVIFMENRCVCCGEIIPEGRTHPVGKGESIPGNGKFAV